SAKIKERLKNVGVETISIEVIKQNISDLADADFVHLHNHSQFSVLQSTMGVDDLVAAAAEHNMGAVALTDHANMMGAFHFVKAVSNHNRAVKANNDAAIEKGEKPTAEEVKRILGCECFVCEDHTDKTRKDNGYQIVFLAKSKKGYHNLAKLSSHALVDGFYYLPSIDRKLIQQYKEDLIVLTGNLYGEVPSKILNVGENQA